MINVYVDCVKFKEFHYVEDELSSYEIVHMEKDDFVKFVKSFCMTYEDIHTCYPAFVNHMGRFHREGGVEWIDDEVHVYCPEYPTDDIDVDYEKHEFNENGQLKDWPFGIFG